MSRIIAGSRGGRRITVPPGERTRPTTDRVREALFSAIAAWAGTAGGAADEALAGLSFCDLYAHPASGGGAVDPGDEGVLGVAEGQVLHQVLHQVQQQGEGGATETSTEPGQHNDREYPRADTGGCQRPGERGHPGGSQCCAVFRGGR